MPRIHVFTSAAANYLPKVRALAASIKKHHPEIRLHLALADEKPAWLRLQDEPFDELIEIKDLGIPHLRQWTFCHAIVELSTAIKPFVLRKLLKDKDCSAVLFFDPDIVLFSRLDDMLREFDAGSILLTPHVSRPEASIEAVMDHEIGCLTHGLFNLGYLGVRNDQEGRRFADWWADRCYHFCRDALDKHLFTDQKWADFVPVFFEGVKILKSPRFNVATWNITTRRVSGSLETGIVVDGRPLGFYHFTGFDRRAHHVMAEKYGKDNTAVMELISWYESEIRRRDDGLGRQYPWAFARFSNGEPITKQHRLIYRARRDLQRAFPDPFKAEAPSYFDWFRWRAAEEQPQIMALQDSGPLQAFEPTEPARFDWAPAKRAARLLCSSPRQALGRAKKARDIYRSCGLREVVRRFYR